MRIALLDLQEALALAQVRPSLSVLLTQRVLGPGPEDPKAVEVFQDELVGEGNGGNLRFRAQS